MNISSLTPEQLEEAINSGQLESAASAATTNDPNLQTSSSSDQDSSTMADRYKFIQPILEEISGDSSGASSAKEEKQETQTNHISSQTQQGTEILVPQRVEGFEFDDPVELLFLLDDDIREGRILLHNWQIEFMLDFAKGGSDHEHPFHALVRAANGSGKDKYIIAACAVWLSMRYLRANCVITSSSGQQLDTQTCRHITFLCEQANKKIYPGIWKINYRHYVCLATASPIDCFATDEPGKAEGFHPLAHGCKMALFMSEAKTVTDEINSAYDRCDGYTHRIHVSSPGAPKGHFYEDCLSSIPRNTLSDVTAIDPSLWIHYLITAFDCSHISKVRIKKLIDKYGIDDPLVQSSIYAEFSSHGEKVVIPFNFVNQCVNSTVKWEQEPYNDAGLDLADGGDETVLIVRNGNKIIDICPFRLDNSDDTFHHLDELLREKELNNPQSIINADCGGIGKPTLDRLVRCGWTNIRYIDNRHAARDKFAFYKRATEDWWHLRMLMQRRLIIIPNDKKLKEQLAGRYYKLRDGLRHLLSKQDQKKDGYLSPDRADGTVLAFRRYKSDITDEVEEDKLPFKQPEQPKPPADFTLRGWIKEKQDDSQWNRNWSRGKDFSIIKEELELNNALIRQQRKQEQQEITV